MNLPTIDNLFSVDLGLFVFKILILVLLFIYMLFTFIVADRIRAFNRIVHIAQAHASNTLQIIALAQFFLALALFFLAFVML